MGSQRHAPATLPPGKRPGTHSTGGCTHTDFWSCGPLLWQTGRPWPQVFGIMRGELWTTGTRWRWLCRNSGCRLTASDCVVPGSIKCTDKQLTLSPISSWSLLLLRDLRFSQRYWRSYGCVLCRLVYSHRIAPSTVRLSGPKKSKRKFFCIFSDAALLKALAFITVTVLVSHSSLIAWSCR
jgi:hypothetical protein